MTDLEFKGARIPRVPTGVEALLVCGAAMTWWYGRKINGEKERSVIFMAVVQEDWGPQGSSILYWPDWRLTLARR
jgi:hypothetical protein